VHYLGTPCHYLALSLKCWSFDICYVLAMTLITGPFWPVFGNSQQGECAELSGQGMLFLNLSWQVPAVSTTCAIFGIVKRRQLCHLPIAVFCFDFKQELENDKMGTIPWCVFTFRTAEPMPSRHIWFRQGVIENEANRQ
jgi:hypothetical protein